ncbi:MAG: hypothetical protein Q8P11_00240 [bacterium]|nr:hypothetical protein [bacterium]
MQNESLHITKDRFEIYVLLATHCEVANYNANNKGQIYFHFKNKKKCEQALNMLLSKKLKLYAHEMIGAIRDAQAIFRAN